jgi:2-polyprenyl-3-methyl-5-hydroxy-6-metoxy-1,4-benzoquinol methylase
VEGIKYFNLGNIPLVNNLCNSREDSLVAERFPLALNYYVKSKLTSLDFAVDGERMFSHYLYKSSVNGPYIEHCKEMFDFIQQYVDIQDSIKIVDVGGNDGTLLHTFKSITDKQLDVLNIDASKNLTELSVQRGVPALNEFFNVGTMLRYRGTIDVITSTNVFQHLKDIDSFVKAIEISLTDDGIWVLEFPYWLHSMLTNQFDQIYHEHMYYHTVTPLDILMRKNGLRIIDVVSRDIHGGSVRLVIAKDQSKHTTKDSVQQFITDESKYSITFYFDWGNKILDYIKQSKETLLNLKAEGKTIYGFGAAAKGCVYLNAMGIDYNVIDVVIDDTDLKQGKFIPGTGIEVVNRSILETAPPDYILILPHNFKDHIIQSLSQVYKGKFIVLLPEIQII